MRLRKPVLLGSEVKESRAAGVEADLRWTSSEALRTAVFRNVKLRACLMGMDILTTGGVFEVE